MNILCLAAAALFFVLALNSFGAGSPLLGGLLLIFSILILALRKEVAKLADPLGQWVSTPRPGDVYPCDYFDAIEESSNCHNRGTFIVRVATKDGNGNIRDEGEFYLCEEHHPYKSGSWFLNKLKKEGFEMLSIEPLSMVNPHEFSNK